ncbi:YvcK family protein [Candidatus Dojkabacteria bacterium]|uniref:Putative gluconeogenesis factor n=1 Tax=Candidatus Dojkabacteria bacterium TaxID=2099670 RepID=A0A955LA46_9BACT|nr:YvcK family protein [Candidatus Dojkabacteria bacterium]
MNKKVVVIGGGTGSYTILSGLKELENIEITAIVASTDSGGSTGRLRDEFGYLPVGDIRQCLVALAENSEEQRILQKLFTYRFDKGGNGLEGHNFGNLFMTALREIVGNELIAIKYIEKILNIKGKVYPVTLDDCQLVAEYENGEVVIGESNIDEPQYPHDGRLKISKLSTKPKSETHAKVIDSIKQADLIIIGPGDLYTSIIANFIIDGVRDAIKKSSAKKIYISNLVTKFGQTFDFKLSDHLNEVEKYSTKMDYILVNSKPLSREILKKYKLENAYPVVNDLLNDGRIILTDLLATEKIKTIKGDILKRSLIRHDSVKIASTIKEFL